MPDNDRMFGFLTPSEKEILGFGRRSPQDPMIDRERKIVHLAKRHYARQLHIDARQAIMFETKEYKDAYTKGEILRFEASIYAELDKHIVVKRKPISVHQDEADIAYPKTWWDAFKERWFPKWMLRRFPVEMESIYIPGIHIEEKEIDVDVPIFKSCYINLPDHGDTLEIYQVVTPEDE